MRLIIPVLVDNMHNLSFMLISLLTVAPQQIAIQAVNVNLKD